MIAKSNQKLSMQKLHKQGWKINSLFGCIPLRWSGSGSVIRDHTDHGRSNEPKNPLPEWIHQFIWSTMIRVISDHWSWSGSSQRNAPVVHHEADHWSRWISHLDNSNGYPVCLLSPFLFCFINCENMVSLYPKNIGKTFCYVKPVQALSRWTQKTN